MGIGLEKRKGCDLKGELQQALRKMIPAEEAFCPLVDHRIRGGIVFRMKDTGKTPLQWESL